MNHTVSRRLLSLLVCLAIVLPLFPSRIPAAGETGGNLALNRPVIVSGNELDDGSFSPDMMVDGKMDTRWSSHHDDAAWCAVDLGTPTTFSKVVIAWEQGAAHFKLQASDDAQNWTDIYTRYETAVNDAKVNEIELELPVTARYVKMQGIRRAGSWGYSIFEFEIYNEEKTPLELALAAVKPTLSADGKHLQLGQAEGVSFSLYGSENEQVIAPDGTVVQPLVEQEVGVLVRGVDLHTGETGVSAQKTVRVPGQYTGQGENAAPPTVPALREWHGDSGDFVFGEQSKIVLDSAWQNQLAPMRQTLAHDFAEIAGRPVETVFADEPAEGDVFITLDGAPTLGEEGNLLRIGDSLRIEACAYTGAFWGTRSVLQMLRQSGDALCVPKGEARDYPAYEERGLVLDAAQKYFSVSYLETVLKTMSWYKLNRLQLRLGDTTGEDGAVFRLESETFPGLAAENHYSKQAFRALAGLGSTYGVSVVPELPLLSNSAAFTAYDPALGDQNGLRLGSEEAAAFARALLAEYTEGDAPVFSAGEVALGGDGYTGNAADFYAFLDAVTKQLADAGKNARIWGSFAKNPMPEGYSLPAGTVVQQYDDGWASTELLLENGCSYVNSNSADLWLVPFSKDKDQLKLQTLYQSWTAGAGRAPDAHPLLRGASAVCKNDTAKTAGYSAYQVFDRLLPAIGVLGERIWNPDAKMEYDAFAALRAGLGAGPDTSFAITPETDADGVLLQYAFADGTAADTGGRGNDGVLHGVQVIDDPEMGMAARFDGEGYIETPLKGMRYPYTLQFDVKPDADCADTANLFSAAGADAWQLGALGFQSGSGSLGFSREGRRFDFAAGLPAGVWSNVMLQATENEMALYINGELAARMDASSGLQTAFVLPLSRIGDGFAGLLDNLCVYNRMLNENLAANSAAAASGTETTDALLPEYAADQNAATRWSANKSDDAWLQLDLGDIYAFNQIVLHWYTKGARYALLASNDGENWETIYTENNGGSADGEQVISFDTQFARYVRFQGIERWYDPRSSTYQSYSLSEMEVTKDVFGQTGKTAQLAKAALDALRVPAEAAKDFEIVMASRESAPAAFASSAPEIITVLPNDRALVEPPERDTLVTLTAAVTAGRTTLHQEYPVLVRARDVEPFAYTVYPIVQSQKTGGAAFTVTREVNVVLEPGVDAPSRAYLARLLDAYNLTPIYTDELRSDRTNLLLGLRGADGAAGRYFADKPFDATTFAHHDAYLLRADAAESGTIAVLGGTADGVYFALATLEQMLSQSGRRISEVTIQDWADTQFRGFIEGFYGVTWSHADRRSLMDFGSRLKMNGYIYGPKNDEYHAGRWRELYPANKLAELKELIQKGKDTKVEFIWAIHPGNSIDLASEADYQCILAKYEQLYAAGVRQFALFMDDIDFTEAWRNREPLVAMLNRLNDEFIEAKGDVKPLIFVPTFYTKGSAGSGDGLEYTEALSRLKSSIQIMFTGDGVMSDIHNDTMQWFKQKTGRDVYIWWNHPVNDYCNDLLLLGESYQLDNDVQNMRGFFANPMNQAESSKISLFSVADYTWNIEAYRQTESWENAFRFVAPGIADALHTLAKNVSDPSRDGAGVDLEESGYLKEAFAEINRKLAAGEDVTEDAVVLLDAFETMQRDSAIVRNSAENPKLTREVCAWAEALQKLGAAGEQAIRTLLAVHAGGAQPAALWESYAEAVEQLAQSRNCISSYSGPAVRAGRKRVYPFIEQLLKDIQRAAGETVLKDAVYAEELGVYTNLADSGALRVERAGSHVTLSGAEAITLQPGEYIGIRLDTLKNVRRIEAGYLADGMALEASDNGIEWRLLPEGGSNEAMTAKYLRLRNAGEAPAAPALRSMEVQLSSQISMDALTISSTMQTYSGTLDDLVDGNADTVYWTTAQKAGSYVLFDFGREIELYDAAVYMSNSDYLRSGALEISVDGLSWQVIGEIDNTGYVESFISKFNADGAPARFARLRVTKDNAAWLKLGEVEFNKTAGSENAVLCDTEAGGRTDWLTDADLSTGFVPAAHEAGSLTFRNVNNPGASRLLVLQSAGRASGALVEAVTPGGVYTVGTLAQAYNVFDLPASEGVLEIRISWTGDLLPAIYEIATLSDTPQVEKPVISGTNDGAYVNAQVVLTADRAVTWIVNGRPAGTVSDSLTLADEGVYAVWAVDASGSESDTLRFTIDLTPPRLTADCAEGGVTSQNVTFTADEESRFYNGDTLLGTGTSVTVTEPGAYAVTAVDRAGNRSAVYRVTIQKETLVLTGAPENGVTRGNVSIRSNRKATFYINGETDGSLTYGVRVTEEGVFEVVAVDESGARASVSFTIDRTKPTFTATVPSDTLTNQAVTITASEEARFEIDGETVSTGERYTIDREGVTVVRIYDLAGNYGGFYRARIDRQKPVLSAVIEGTDHPVQNGSVVANSVILHTSEPASFIVNGEETQRANFVKLKANGIFTVQAVDAAGNVSEPFIVTISRK